VIGNDHFSVQMADLCTADAVYRADTLRVQEQLIAWYKGGNYGLGRGISAMPSMHVALAFLFFLAISKVSKWAGWVFGIFAVLIQIASIHLAYHFAVAGYVSVVLVALIWWAMGKATAYLQPNEAATTAA
jgi:membrane-associated phospholipid phosphatase